MFICLFFSTGKRTYLSLKEQRLHDWSTIRDDMYEAFISTEAPSTVSCHECNKEAQLFKCIDCTPWEMVCEDCLYRRHQYPHLHMFEAWRVSNTYCLNFFLWNHVCTIQRNMEHIVLLDMKMSPFLFIILKLEMSVLLSWSCNIAKCKNID